MKLVKAGYLEGCECFILTMENIKEYVCVCADPVCIEKYKK